MTKVLLIASQDSDARHFEKKLRKEGYDVDRVNSIEEARRHVKHARRIAYDMVCCGGNLMKFEEAREGILTRDAPQRRKVAA